VKPSWFEQIVKDMQMLLCRTVGRATSPRAVILESRTMQSTAESWARAGYDDPNGAVSAINGAPWCETSGVEVAHTLLAMVCGANAPVTYHKLRGHHFDTCDRQAVQSRLVRRLETLGNAVQFTPTAPPAAKPH
jgi:hypothetical protein